MTSSGTAPGTSGLLDILEDNSSSKFDRFYYHIDTNPTISLLYFHLLVVL